MVVATEDNALQDLGVGDGVRLDAVLTGSAVGLSQQSYGRDMTTPAARFDPQLLRPLP